MREKLIGVSGTTEIGNGTDPYVGYTALTLNEGPAAGTIAYMEAGSQGNASITGNATVITAITSQVGTWHGKTYSSYALLANDGTGSVDLYGILRLPAIAAQPLAMSSTLRVITPFMMDLARCQKAALVSRL